MHNALIVGDFRRKDFHFLAKAVSQKYNVYFIELDIQTNIENESYKDYGNEIFISEFRNADDILESLNIKKVFFYSLVNIHEVLLNIICKERLIPTIHVEHGLRDFNLTFGVNELKKQQRKPLLIGFIKRLFSKIYHFTELKQLKEFNLSSTNCLAPESKKFYTKYVKIRRANSFLDTCLLVKNPLRLPDSYISFSNRIFEYHRKKDHLGKFEKVSFVGFPQFDDLYNLDKSVNQELLFIDQPFVEKGLFGWNYDFKKKLLTKLHNEVAETFNYRLKIKPHPTSDLSILKSLENDLKLFSIIGKDEMYSNDIVLGFASTMLLPLVAQSSTLCFGLEIHPYINFNYSKCLTSTKAVKEISSLDELKNILNNPDQIIEEQRKSKDAFNQLWMHKFDGNSFKRLLNVI